MKLSFDYNNGRGHFEVDLSEFFPNTKANTKRLLEVFILSNNSYDLSEKVYLYIAETVKALQADRAEERLKNDQKKVVNITTEIRRLLSCSEVFISEYGFEILTDADAESQKMKKVDVYALRTNGNGEPEIKVFSGYEFKKGNYTFHVYKEKLSEARRIHIIFPSCGLALNNSFDIIKAFKNSPEFITDEVLKMINNLVKSDKYKKMTDNFKKVMEKCGYEVTGVLQPIEICEMKIKVEKEIKSMNRNDKEMEVFQGMKFVDGSGEVFTITNLNSMSVEFNGGTRTIYDFGTKRTIKDILSAFGEGSRRLMLYEVEEMEKTAQKPQKEPETMADDTYTTAEEKETKKATENEQEEKKETIYKYGMRLRGFSIGCQPAGAVERLDDTTGKYWDIITYNRPLTAEEMRTYSLDDLNDTDTGKAEDKPDSTGNMLQPSENLTCEEIGKNGEVLEEKAPEISGSIPEGTGGKNSFAMENKNFKINHITKENGKYFAELKNSSSRIHTGNVYGWNGLTYKQLSEKLKCDYNVELPKLEDLKLFKQTQSRKIYLMEIPEWLRDKSEIKEEPQPEPPTDNYFIENMETGKIELHFEKSAYMELSEEQKREIKSNFLFSKYSSAWVSRCKFPNTFRAKELVKKLGLADGGKTGETLSFEEQQQIKASKAERRADRMEYRAEKAQERGETLQKPINDMHGDIAFFTQPNINTSAGRAFTHRREKMWAAWESGFNEFKKSEYYKERAEQARQTAQQTRPTDKGFIQRRIDEAEKTIRSQKKNIKEYEDILTRIENGETVTAWNGKPYTAEKLTEYIEHHNRILDDAMSKTIYYYDCMEEVGGLKYSKSNIKKGDIVNIGRWKVKVESTGTKNISGVILHDDLTPCILNEQTGYAMRTKANYAEIKELVTV